MDRAVATGVFVFLNLNSSQLISVMENSIFLALR